MTAHQKVERATGRRRKHQDDPLVWLDSRRLRAAMEVGGWTVTPLASRMTALRGTGEENPQTVHHLSRGDGRKRCRRSRRALLARVLKVAEDWLAGEEPAPPSPGDLPVGPELMASPKASLAIGRLLDKCRAAVIRDLEREPRAQKSGAFLRPEGEAYYAVMLSVGHLLSAPRWRGRLLVGESVNPKTDLQALAANRVPALTPEHEAAAIGLATAWEFILEPWLTGDAALDYQRFRALAKLLNPSVGTILPDNMPAPGAGPTAHTSPYVYIDWPRDDAIPVDSAEPTARGGTRRGRARVKKPRKRGSR